MNGQPSVRTSPRNHHQYRTEAYASTGTARPASMIGPGERPRQVRSHHSAFCPVHVITRTSAATRIYTGLDLTSGLGRVVGDMLTGLHEERDTLTSGQFDAVTDRLVELLCMLAAGDDRPTAPGHLTDVERVVRRYIREQATDPDVTGATMAQALGWSLRQVQLALQHAGTTPRELIREERLRLVRDRLRAPTYRHMTITELAYASGFSSSSALSTAFRQRFGVSPREMRHTGPQSVGDTRRS
ncbi:helix-turn-helix domain-containing protein [Streptomyces sp. PSRA5]|uniref:helix-turn-helix domain-containing protein n=1 Tax=Streptomyces panacea TaxID=3035064 RepID=UPI00339BC3B8